MNYVRLLSRRRRREQPRRQRHAELPQNLRPLLQRRPRALLDPLRRELRSVLVRRHAVQVRRAPQRRRRGAVHHGEVLVLERQQRPRRHRGPDVPRGVVRLLERDLRGARERLRRRRRREVGVVRIRIVRIRRRRRRDHRGVSEREHVRTPDDAQRVLRDDPPFRIPRKRPRLGRYRTLPHRPRDDVEVLRRRRAVARLHGDRRRRAVARLHGDRRRLPARAHSLD
eukprot:30057-Pelagococcus_subviridis.AAC.1